MDTPAIFIEQFVDNGLGNSAYLVGSHDAKQAVLIDPLRDVDRYLSAAERLGVKITHVLDTHLHADFVSGAREIAARTGAAIGASRGASLGFDHQPLADGDVVSTGGFNIDALETPGHTPEHISFLVTPGSANSPRALFSGGALIVGGAARTDLISHEMTLPLARMLYHTIHDKFLTLPDEVGVYPTHGAGSFCIAPSSPDRTTTIGRERKSNPLARAQTEEEFVHCALTGLPSYPVYYQHLRAVNQRGPAILGGIPVLKPLSPQVLQEHVGRGAFVIDARPAREFSRGHVPGSLSIPLDAPLITWAGWLVPFGSQIVLVTGAEGQRMEATRQLIRIGYDNLLGYLDGGIDAWVRAGYTPDTVPTMAAAELRERLHSGDALVVLDVRQQSEWEAGHIPGAVHIENGRLAWDDLRLPKDKPIAVHCAHRDRSMAGVSVLRRRGYLNAIQVDGGFSKWERAGYEVERGEA